MGTPHSLPTLTTARLNSDSNPQCLSVFGKIIFLLWAVITRNSLLPGRLRTFCCFSIFILLNIQRESASLVPLIVLETQCCWTPIIAVCSPADCILILAIVSQWFISDFGINLKTTMPNYSPMPHAVASFFALSCLDHFMVTCFFVGALLACLLMWEIKLIPLLYSDSHLVSTKCLKTSINKATKQGKYREEDIILAASDN